MLVARSLPPPRLSKKAEAVSATLPDHPGTDGPNTSSHLTTSQAVSRAAGVGCSTTTIVAEFRKLLKAGQILEERARFSGVYECCYFNSGIFTNKNDGPCPIGLVRRAIPSAVEYTPGSGVYVFSQQRREDMMKMEILVALGLVISAPSIARPHICQPAVDAQLQKAGIAAVAPPN